MIDCILLFFGFTFLLLTLSAIAHWILLAIDILSRKLLNRHLCNDRLAQVPDLVFYASLALTVIAAYTHCLANDHAHLKLAFLEIEHQSNISKSVVFILFVLVLFQLASAFLLNFYSQAKFPLDLQESGELFEEFNACLGKAGINSVQLALHENDNYLSPFVSGLIQQRIHFHRSLLTKLSLFELRAVLFHEIYHIRRKDNLKKILFSSVCASLNWFTPLTSKFRLWKLNAEMECDQYAATMVGDYQAVAWALLKVARHINDESRDHVSHVNYCHRSNLEQRIQRLVATEGCVMSSEFRPKALKLLIGLIALAISNSKLGLFVFCVFELTFGLECAVK